LALSVECFHKASLIHDDIEDNDEIRYGKETIHSQHGIPIAINIGDYLLGEGYRLIADSGLPVEIIRNGIQVISKGHIQLTIGQGTELLSIRSGQILSLTEMLEVFENKTAAAFKVSLLLGATIGQADPLTLTQLDNFSKYVGIAYQIKDDLSDYQGQKGDIVNRKFSILLSLLKEKTDEEMLNLMDSGEYAKVFSLIEEYNIVKEAQALLSSYINQARNCLENFSNLGLKLALHEILGKTFKDYI
jgi:geranylgeranyl pyrophosphate synthase